jgi:mannonate dehydratase
MKETWRWFGPDDPVSLQDIAQAGATGIVTALHHLPAGVIWSEREISLRNREILLSKSYINVDLKWSVVESLPVSEDIKRQSGDWRTHIKNYCISLENLAAAGISTICYNFMPILDWTRTDLEWKLPNGATCMRFDLIDFIAFDMFILNRNGACNDYSEDLNLEAKKRFEGMSKETKENLTSNIVSGLPGAAAKFSLKDVKLHLKKYENITERILRTNFVSFLKEVAPVAHELGLRLCCHPDDPPFPLLGLPRIMSTEKDYKIIMDEIPLKSNGITLCSGSLGVRAENNLIKMMSRLGDRVHFLHLRNVKRESDMVPNSFYEEEHLKGNTDMVSLIRAILEEEKRRRKNKREDWSIPFRPDHGHNILDDLKRKSKPGYPAIGRLKGLAELRGILTALSNSL